MTSKHDNINDSNFPKEYRPFHIIDLLTKEMLIEPQTMAVIYTEERVKTNYRVASYALNKYMIGSIGVGLSRPAVVNITDSDFGYSTLKDYDIGPEMFKPNVSLDIFGVSSLSHSSTPKIINLGSPLIAKLGRGVILGTNTNIYSTGPVSRIFINSNSE